MSRIWNGRTGKIEQVENVGNYAPDDFHSPPWTMGDAQVVAPSAPAIADFLGVPVKWVLIAGVVLFVLPYFFKKAR